MKRKRFTQEEKQFIEENYQTMNYGDIAKQLNRTYYSIESYINNYNLPKLSKEELSRRIIKKNKKQVGKNNSRWKGGISKNYYHYRKLQVERYPEKVKARKKVCEAIKSGKLVREPCEVCGDEKVQARHDDYSNPLKVRWLCKKCHDAFHMKQGNYGNMKKS